MRGCRWAEPLKEFCILSVYPIDIAGLHRELPICKVTDDLYIAHSSALATQS